MGVLDAGSKSPEQSSSVIDASSLPPNTNMPCRLPKIRFSLLSLLLGIGGISLWLGLIAHTVRERKQTLDWIERRGGYYDNYVLDDQPFPAGYEPPDWYRAKLSHFPRYRLWFGDTAISYINVTHTPLSWEERQTIAALFPEACVMPERPEGFSKVNEHAKRQNSR